MAELTIGQLWDSLDNVDRNQLQQNSGKTLFNLQSALMDRYHQLGRLPSSEDFDLSLAVNQKTIRELINYLEEEMVEAELAHTKLSNEVITPDLFQQGPPNIENPEIAKLVSAYNEEVADALHFWIELFIFSGITNDYMVNYYTELAHAKYMNRVTPCFIEMSLSFASYYSNHLGLLKGPAGTVFMIGHTEGFLTQGLWKAHLINGRRLGTSNKMYQYLYYSIKALKTSQNLLKNKPWKNSQDTLTDSETFRQYIVEGWINWTIALHLTGYTDHKAMIGCYLLKNLINYNRLDGNDA